MPAPPPPAPAPATKECPQCCTAIPAGGQALPGVHVDAVACTPDRRQDRLSLPSRKARERFNKLAGSTALSGKAILTAFQRRTLVVVALAVLIVACPSPGFLRSCGLVRILVVHLAAILDHGQPALHVVELRSGHHVLRTRFQSFLDVLLRRLDAVVGQRMAWRTPSAIVPGFFFSSDWIFSKKSTNAAGS